MKTYLEFDVYQAAKKRIAKTLKETDKFYVSFSGGKDSGVMLNMVIEEAKKQNKLPVHVLIIDMEAQYQHTTDYVEKMANNKYIKAYWVCLPLHLRNAVSQLQPHWICWDETKKNMWVRDYPKHHSVINSVDYFPFFRRGMEFEEFVPEFGKWFSQGRQTACFVGIRSDESLNRFRTIASASKKTWKNKQWTTLINKSLFNVYPIYDWTTQDIWVANGKNKWSYNKIYDLMNMAGLTIHQARLCQPYGDDQRKGLYLFKILEPETWTKIVARVQGANFGNRYVQLTGSIMGNIKIELPENHTWKSYAHFLLATMPPPTSKHYRAKIAKFLWWWRKNGKEKGFRTIPNEADRSLEAKKQAPSWRRICKTLLKNDYWCKGLSFSQTKREMEKQTNLITKYMDIL